MNSVLPAVRGLMGRWLPDKNRAMGTLSSAITAPRIPTRSSVDECKHAHAHIALCAVILIARDTFVGRPSRVTAVHAPGNG